ncbi:OVARIAN TUMOR DOMAIN-containing deubiquitinating enzyme 12-like isoform X2 [Zingiber officinale]|uniref:OVARIAN TUMOR DOMAIN-containing deubiquitinating enzyme 12-like isoform X2 n=1 Tax=Zingiber officinale TaxID=94328 RepID=UPI001C4A8D95|nr:OVARIAN TUMOR DOMAIN-containing deubiquitinating enzyme 12-like isoform X2 [Zingiber officinale]
MLEKCNLRLLKHSSNATNNPGKAYQWDFGIFDPLPNPPYYGSGADQETTFYSNYCVREDTSRTACEEHMPESVFTQNLFGPYTREYNSVAEDGWEVNDETGPSTLCSSPGGYSCRREFSMKISDEYSVVDGEVGRRLNQMHPIPHVPRINGDIPSFDEATSDHQRLLERLRLYDLIERKVQGDGNCQFRALSDQLYQTSEHHEFVRQQVVEQLKSHPEIYDGYVPMTYSDYVKKISQSGEWGDHVTLQAAADSYGVKIFVMTSFKDTCYIEILPSIEKSKRVIFLSFWAEVHYNSIYLEEQDLPTADTKKKKRWWQLGNKY